MLRPLYFFILKLSYLNRMFRVDNIDLLWYDFLLLANMKHVLQTRTKGYMMKI